MRTISMAASVALALGVAACDTHPGEGKPAAKVVDQVAAPEPTPDGEDVSVYAFDESGSSVGFVGAKVTKKHEGTFHDFEGSIRVPGDAIEKGQVKVTVKTASVEADEVKLTNHLKSPDFFDVEKYPEATFVSTAIEAKPGEGGATHEVTGNLTLHGMTKTIAFPARIELKDGQVAVDSEFAINRRDFAIEYPGMPDDLIRDDVLLKLSVKAPKGAG